MPIAADDEIERGITQPHAFQREVRQPGWKMRIHEDRAHGGDRSQDQQGLDDGDDCTGRPRLWGAGLG